METANPCCRKLFEPFGGMKSAVIAARDNEPGDTRLKLAGFNGDQMTSDPDYEQPLVKELELVLVVFDILYCRGQVQQLAPVSNARTALRLSLLKLTAFLLQGIVSPGAAD